MVIPQSSSEQEYLHAPTLPRKHELILAEGKYIYRWLNTILTVFCFFFDTLREAEAPQTQPFINI